jgi:hypothetical protein
MVDEGQRRERTRRFLRIVRAARCYVSVSFSHFRTLIRMLLFAIADAALFSYIQVYLLTDDTDTPKLSSIPTGIDTSTYLILRYTVLLS